MKCQTENMRSCHAPTNLGNKKHPQWNIYIRKGGGGRGGGEVEGVFLISESKLWSNQKIFFKLLPFSPLLTRWNFAILKFWTKTRFSNCQKLHPIFIRTPDRSFPSWPAQTPHCTTEYFRAKLCSAYLKHSSYFWSTWWAASTPSTPSARGWTSTPSSATWSRSGCWEGWGPSSRGSTDVNFCLPVILTSSTKIAPHKGRITYTERTHWGQVWQFLSSTCLLVFPVGN